MPETEKLTYEQAADELNQILTAIQQDKCGIDRLTELTRRATFLLKVCREKLTTTESELNQILQSLKE